MHLDVLDLRNFYHRTQLGRPSVLAVIRLAVAAVMLAGATAEVCADTPPLDPSIVENCFQSTSLDTLSAECVGKAADKCSQTPPLNQSTMDIWECYQAEAQVWKDILASLEARKRLSWRAQDKANRDSGHNIEAEGMAKAADFETLILAERSYRSAMCGMIYSANGEGSMKNIYAARCDMDMASSWAFKMRDVDWNRPGVSIRREP